MWIRVHWGGDFLKNNSLLSKYFLLPPSDNQLPKQPTNVLLESIRIQTEPCPGTPAQASILGSCDVSSHPRHICSLDGRLPKQSEGEVSLQLTLKNKTYSYSYCSQKFVLGM